MPQQPSHSAKWCLDQLFQHMELNLKNRTEAKTGRATSLELNKLSNLMAHAGLAHQSKVRTLMSPSRLRRLDGAITVTPDQRVALREVFIFYCGWAERHNYTYMSSSQFLRFCKDTLIMAGDLDATTLSLLFDKVQLESPENNPGGRITMADWIQALMLIALQTMPSIPPQDAWERLINDHVLMFGAKVDCSHDALAQVLLQPEVVAALGEARHKLKPLFKHYVNEQAISSPQQRQRRPAPSVAAAITTLSRAQSPPHTDQQLQQQNQQSQPRQSQSQAQQSQLLIPLPQSQPQQQHGQAHYQHQFSLTGSASLVQSITPRQGRQTNSTRISMAQPDTDAFMAGALSLPGATGPQHVLDGTVRKLQGLQGQQGPPPSTAASQRSQTQMLQRARAQMPLSAFLRFLQDFEVLPKYINKYLATRCFREARFGPGRDPDEGADLARIEFNEFVEAVCRVALVAYNYQIPAEEEKLLCFEASYHPTAKHLWSTRAQEAFQTSLASPDEVFVPTADRDASIGAEDAAHFSDSDGCGVSDDGGITGGRWGGARVAPSAKSQAIFRTARSLANCRVKQTLPRTKSGHGGAEILEMHQGDADHLANDRPLHLKAFSPAWIGEPPAAMSEGATERRRPKEPALQMGVYSGDVGLPPVFRQRAEQMIGARVVREQALEGLRLLYVGQRRQEQLQRTQAAKTKRHGLQHVSGQRVVETEQSPVAMTQTLPEALAAFNL